MGGYLLLYPKAKIDVLFIFVIFFKIFSLPAWVILGFWFTLQLLNGFLTASGVVGVAYWAHIGGFVAGLLLCWPLFQRRGGSNFWHTTDGYPRTQMQNIWYPALVSLKSNEDSDENHLPLRNGRARHNSGQWPYRYQSVQLQLLQCARGRSGHSVGGRPKDPPRKEHLTLYQLVSKTAKHYFCKTRGIYTHHQKLLNLSEMGVTIAPIEGLHPQDFESIPWVEDISYPSEMRS